MTERPPMPTTPPKPGRWWQYDEGRGWHQVAPLNLAQLQRYWSKRNANG